MLATAMTLHILSLIIWIGGMFFAHLVLRPVVNQLLEPSLRLPLMTQVLGRFFKWVWGAIILLWATGLWLILDFYKGHATHAVLTMLGISGVMTLLFIYLFFIPFPHLQQAVKMNDFKTGGQELGTIRQIVATNLVLGLTITVIAVVGHYL